MWERTTTNLLRNQQHLACRLARLQIAVRLRRLSQRIAMFQPQFQAPLGHPTQHIARPMLQLPARRGVVLFNVGRVTYSDPFVES